MSFVTSPVGSSCPADQEMGERELFDEVPVLPVVVPIAAAAFAILGWHLRRRGLLTAPRAAVALAMCVYVAGVVANTVFPIFVDKPGRDAPWDAFVNATPLVGYEAADAVMNIGVFVPVGVLVALAVPRWTWWRVLASVAFLSLSIEVSQYATAHLLGGGHIADVNDVFFNVVGGALGCLMLSALSLVSLTDRVIGRFRWS